MDFWSEIRDFYLNGTFCDLELFPGDVSSGVKCHQIVLSSVSSVLRMTLRSTVTSNDVISRTAVMIPDFSFQEVKELVGSVYDTLCDDSTDSSDSQGRFWNVNQKLTETLGLLEVPKILPCSENWLQTPLQEQSPVSCVQYFNSLIELGPGGLSFLYNMRLGIPLSCSD